MGCGFLTVRDTVMVSEFAGKATRIEHAKATKGVNTMSAPTVIPQDTLQRMTNLEIAAAVEQKKLDATIAGQFLLTRFTNKLARRAKKAAAAA